jgi:pimeloyl-ACP methyl ester carboxylesterase
MTMRGVERRTFLRHLALAGMAAGWSTPAGAQRAGAVTRTINTGPLSIAYEDQGDPSGFPVILLHGFPDDVRAYDDVVPPLVRAGYRTLAPYLRGHGPTRFRDPGVVRMAEQAALGQDVIDFADALGLPRFVLAGYDWGGRAAAIVAALHPGRVRAAVLVAGYTIQNTLAPARPVSAEAAQRLWYQWYFNTEQGRTGLEANRREICRHLWRQISPTWRFSDETFDRTAPSFDNPDFVDVVIHSYRHRVGNAPGEARFRDVEARLAERPPITVPSIVLYGADDGIVRPAAEASAAERAVFPNLIARRIVAGVGHFMPREAPAEMSSALLQLLTRTPDR